MKKYINTISLYSLYLCMNEKPLISFEGKVEDIIRVSHLAYTGLRKRNDKKMILSIEDIALIIDFILHNQSKLSNTSRSIETILHHFTTALYRKSRHQKVEKYYFKMIWDNGKNQCGKIPAIKALRSISSLLSNTPHVDDFGSLKWAKYAVESDCYFGPVTQKFLEDTKEFAALREVVTSITNRLSYEQFTEDY